MPNRTEMLHFRATPEEKETIRENAGHAEVALSEWMRFRCLTGDPRYPDASEFVPTQPAVKESEGFRAAPGSVVEETMAAETTAETYEQFMERRVGELMADKYPHETATLTAEAEWTQR